MTASVAKPEQHARNTQRRSFAGLPPAQQAGMLCNDARFQSFVAQQCGLKNERFSPAACAEFIRQACKIDSRRDLDVGGPALEWFNALLTDFDAWTGKIATPR